MYAVRTRLESTTDTSKPTLTKVTKVPNIKNDSTYSTHGNKNKMDINTTQNSSNCCCSLGVPSNFLYVRNAPCTNPQTTTGRVARFSNPDILVFCLTCGFWDLSCLAFPGEVSDELCVC